MREPELDRAARAVVAERLGIFAVAWILPMLAWVVVLTHGAARALLPAVLTTAFQAGALGFALLALRHGARRADVNGAMLGLAMILTVSTIGLFVRVGSVGELLGFVLFTLCTLSALLFPWGWRMELTLTAMVLESGQGAPPPFIVRSVGTAFSPPWARRRNRRHSRARPSR